MYSNSSDNFQQDNQDSVHKFDKEMKLRAPLTNRQFRTVQNRDFLRFCKGLVDEIGEKKAIKLIKEIVSKGSYTTGQRGSKATGKKSLTSFSSYFKGPVFLDTLTMEIVEDTDKIFEINVTECLAYEICKTEKADGELGNACICHGDYAMAEGYNPKMKLFRDKTLMQGHGYCNHRYVLEG